LGSIGSKNFGAWSALGASRKRIIIELHFSFDVFRHRRSQPAVTAISQSFFAKIPS
jgi:hypothetical protein